jgi:O-antigen ligase
MLYVTGAEGAFGDYPLFARPVELCLLMLAPIVARVHLPDFIRNGLRSTIALVAAHLHLFLPFVGLILLNFATSILPGTYLPDGDYKPIYILIFRLAIFAGAVSLGIFLWPDRWRPILRLVLFLMIGSVLWDVAYPETATFSENSGRAAGFQANPNEGALVVVMVAAMAIQYRRVVIIDLIVLFCAFVAVFATLSRGGMLMFAIILVNYVYFTGRGRRLHQIALAPVIVIGGVWFAQTTVSTLIEWSGMFADGNAQDRLAILSFNDGVYDSDESRVQLVPQYLALIEQSPILGHGTGFSASMPQGPHNMYLEYWVNNGILGLILYCWLLASLLIMAWRRRFEPGLVLAQIVTVAGLFFHDLPEQNSFLILAGLAAGISWCEARSTRSVASSPRNPSAARPAAAEYGR